MVFCTHCSDINSVSVKSARLHPNPSLKIGSVNKAFLIWYWQRLKNILFRNKTFLFFKIESWNFQHLFENEFRETSQSFNSFRQLLCTFFLLVVWLSWNFVRFHKFKFQTEPQLSILKNKKVLFLRKIFFKPISIPKQKNFVYRPNFQWRFWLRRHS